MAALSVEPAVIAQTSGVLRGLGAQLRRAGPELDAAAHLPAPEAGTGIGAAASTLASAWRGVVATMTQEFALLADDVAAGARTYLLVEASNTAGFRAASR